MSVGLYQSEAKEIMIRGLKETINPQRSMHNGKMAVDELTQHRLETDTVISTNFTKSVKYFVEHSISNIIDTHLKEIGSSNKETWKIDAHNLSKVFLDQSKLAYVQDNLSNVLDSCLKEVNDPSLKYLNDSELDISPLLQPEHIIEVAECMSSEKPLDVRLNALRVLFKSHFTEAVNGEVWPLLQKRLVENLSDSNIEVFVTCLKAHAKLAACSSSAAIKECTLNLLDSLGQHYYLQHGECKVISMQSMHLYRMAYLTRLLLDIFREATMNAARFGESRLDEMIDNLVQLLSIHIPSKQSRNKHCLSPLEMVSYLDPNCNWLANLTHFTSSRRLFFSSLCKNIIFLRIAMEEIINWLNEPVIPSRNTSNILQGELNVAVHKYSLFCHSLAVFTIICSFGIGCNLFPLNTNKKEDLLSVDDVVRILVLSLNDATFNEILHSKGTNMFRHFFALKVAKLMCLKEVNGGSLLLALLKTEDNCKPLVNSIKVQILDTISQFKSNNNPFLQTEITKKKSPLFLHCVVSDLSRATNLNSGSVKKRDMEPQGPVRLKLGLNGDTSDISPFEMYLKQVICKSKSSVLKEFPCLIQIITRIFKDFDRNLFINYTLRAQIIQCVAEMYVKLQDSFKSSDSRFDNGDINLSGYCSEFILQAAISSLGFHILHELGVIAPLLLDRLHHPIIDWCDYVWLSFVSKAASTSEGCLLLTAESNGMVKKELFRLWNVIEEDCSGSELPVEDISNQLLRIVAALSLSVGGVKSVLNEPRDESDITLTDEYDVRPQNLYILIQHFALNPVNCPSFIHHQFALSVLDLLTSNIDSSLFLQHKFKYQEILLQLQSDNRIDDNSEVIIDECSLLRQKIIQRSYLPGQQRFDVKPTFTAPRPESKLARTKPRSRGTGELARWLSETRLGLHDHNWLKHARKLYRNSCLDDMKVSTILDLLEQVVKVMPETRTMKWQSTVSEGVSLEPEEYLAIQLVIRYGTNHRLIQSTQQNLENLKHFLLLAKSSFGEKLKSIEGFDWFVASAYLVCCGNIERSQVFLSLVSALPSASLLWLRLGEPLILAQMGSVLETVMYEEMPALFQALQSAGLSCWQLCRSWIAQCWWNVLDWPQICHWFALSILHQLDHLLYFCVALFHSNQDYFLRMIQQGTAFEIVKNPMKNFQLSNAIALIEKLHKKYHNTLHVILHSV